MKIIKSIEVIEVPEDEIKILNLHPFSTVIDINNKPYLAQEIQEEIIKGITYHRVNGEKIVIGMTKEVAEILTIPILEFDNLQKKFSIQSAETNRLLGIINNIKSMSFLSRLRFLITGNIT